MRCENRSRTCGTRRRWNVGLSPSRSRLSGNTLKRTNAQTPSYTPRTRRTTHGQRRANASSCDRATPRPSNNCSSGHLSFSSSSPLKDGAFFLKS